MIGHDLPSPIVWRNIVPYVPCMGVTPCELRRQFCMNRSMSIIRRCIPLCPNELNHVRQYMLQTDFLQVPYFEYQSDAIFLSIFFHNRHHDDYIVIYLPH